MFKKNEQCSICVFFQSLVVLLHRRINKSPVLSAISDTTCIKNWSLAAGEFLLSALSPSLPLTHCIFLHVFFVYSSSLQGKGSNNLPNLSLLSEVLCTTALSIFFFFQARRKIKGMTFMKKFEILALGLSLGHFM